MDKWGFFARFEESEAPHGICLGGGAFAIVLCGRVWGAPGMGLEEGPKTGRGGRARSSREGETGVRTEFEGMDHEGGGRAKGQGRGVLIRDLIAGDREADPRFVYYTEQRRKGPRRRDPADSHRAPGAWLPSRFGYPPLGRGVPSGLPSFPPTGGGNSAPF